MVNIISADILRVEKCPLILYVKPSNKTFIIPPFLHFLVFWLLVFEINLASYPLHNTRRAKGINNTSETTKVSFT